MSLKFDPDAAATPPDDPGRVSRMGGGVDRRRWFSEPGRVVWVVSLVVLGTVLPLVWTPLSSPIGWAALAGGLLIAFLIALSIKKETDRLAWRDEARVAPTCRVCGRRYDEPLDEAGVEVEKRCPECGRPTLEGIPR